MAAARSILKFDGTSWSLPDVKREAAKILEHPVLAEPLRRALFSSDARVRMRAADTTRRVTEKNPALLAPHAEELLGLFSESANENWRTRAHLGLVIARVAKTRAQRQRAAGLLVPLYYDQSNVVRCTAIEGWGILGTRQPEIRAQFQPLIEDALYSGTRAMQNRARYALSEQGSRKS